MRPLLHKSKRNKAVLAVAAGLCLLPTAHAAERLTLSNGFDLVCNHHALVEGRIRVYPQASDADYVELSPDAISGVESVPEPSAAPSIAPSIAPATEPMPTHAQEIRNTDAKLTPDDLQQLLSKAGSEHNVNEDLLASVVKAESGGNTHAVSRAGARGLMQLMPGTARQLGVADSFAPDENVRGGSAYLDSLLTRYRDNIALALAAYNAGPEAVDRYHGIPPYHETRAYVARVVHEFNRRIAERRRLSGQVASR